MPLTRRKRARDDEPAAEQPQAKVTRRTTRQTPGATAPPPVQPDPPSRRRPGRPRTSDSEKSRKSTTAGKPQAANQKKENKKESGMASSAPSKVADRTLRSTPHPAPPPARTTRHQVYTNGIVPATSSQNHPTIAENDENAPPSSNSPPHPRTRSIPPHASTKQSGAGSLAPRRQGPRSQKQVPQLNDDHKITKPSSPAHQRRQRQKKVPTPEKPKAKPSSDRNIDKVVFGNTCFRAWYPSYYGKEVLGDISGNSTKSNGSGNATTQVNGVTAGPSNNSNGANQENGQAKLPRKERDNPILDRLYVCPCCFKYSKELVPWWEHVHVCEQSGVVPGEKIYTHPRGKRTIPVPADVTAAQPAKRGPKKKGDTVNGGAPAKATQEPIQDEGEWSIWEVDGEKDVLFCQNLSLFAKLFLDNKSVFFDVTGFKYYLLVYTQSPTSPSSAPAPPVGSFSSEAFGTPNTPTSTPSARHHIVGFFSKEKMSWDNNNLACILVFPPWQRKGLGALLMGISYEISRREGVLGGPEKPISDLGKKGYKRFWAGEVARWILGLEMAGSGDETIIDVEECSQATWIVPEDCLLVLKEMGVVEDAGIGKPKARVEEVEEEQDGEKQVVEDVPRVRLSKAALREWVEKNGISLERTCDPGGFVEGYAIKESTPEQEA